jgi:RNA polymerase sigma-70 factor (ECF subfamily)
MSWIHVAAVRVAIDLKRRLQPDAAAALPAGAEDYEHDPESAYLRERYRDDLQVAFREALGALSARQRNILRMHFLDGVSLDRMAAMYGMHRTTMGRCVTQACDRAISTTRKKLGARVNLPARAVDSIIGLLRSAIDFSASMLLSDLSIDSAAEDSI